MVGGQLSRNQCDQAGEGETGHDAWELGVEAGDRREIGRHRLDRGDDQQEAAPPSVVSAGDIVLARHGLPARTTRVALDGHVGHLACQKSAAWSDLRLGCWLLWVRTR